MKRSIWLAIILSCLLALPLVSGTKKGPVLPSDCDATDDIGRTFILTTAEAGKRIYICNGASGWEQQLGSTGNTNISAVWPVGSIYISVSSTNPATSLGFGTWQPFAAGRVLVGIDPSQSEFDTAEETGGSKTHTLTIAEIPPHIHTQSLPSSQTGSQSSGTKDTSTTGTSSDALTTSSTGGGSAHNNLQPYVTVYVWRRVS